MPSLVVFAAGRQIVIDKDNGAISIVAIFSGFNAQKQKDALEENEAIENESIVAVPLDWGCVAIFRRTPEDEGKVYDVLFLLVGPDGKKYLESTSQFAIAELTHSIPLRVNGFPASQEGTYFLTVSLREYDTDTDWNEVGRYPIDIEYTSQKESQAMNEQ